MRPIRSSTGRLSSAKFQSRRPGFEGCDQWNYLTTARIDKFQSRRPGFEGCDGTQYFVLNPTAKFQSRRPGFEGCDIVEALSPFARRYSFSPVDRDLKVATNQPTNQLRANQRFSPVDRDLKVATTNDPSDAIHSIRFSPVDRDLKVATMMNILTLPFL